MVPIRIALDAMGGDQGPAPLVAGAVAALAAEPDLWLQLVGEPETLRAALQACRAEAGERLQLVPAGGAIPMGDHPAEAVRHRPDASVVVAVQRVAHQEADACYSAGHSGATMAAALFHLHRLPGVARPAIGTTIPRPGGGAALLLDAGAQVDCRPEWLAQFAVLGSAYSERVLGVPQPRVGLLSIGEEPGKGGQLVRDADRLLRQTPVHYLGPVEGRDLVSGRCDVLVTDGFTGNVALKVAEGVAEQMLRTLREAAHQGWRARAGGWLLRPALGSLRAETDWRRTGGVPLLGVRGLVYIGHGRSDALAVRHGIRVAAAAARAGTAALLAEAVRGWAATVPTADPPAPAAAARLSQESASWT